MRTVIRMLSDVIEQFGHQRLHLLQPAVESGMYAQESFQPMTGYVRSKSTCTHHTLVTGFLLLMDYSYLGTFAGGPKQHASSKSVYFHYEGTEANSSHSCCYFRRSFETNQA